MTDWLALLSPNRVVAWRRLSVAAGTPGRPVAYSSAAVSFDGIATGDRLWVITLLQASYGRVPSLVARITVDRVLRPDDRLVDERDRGLLQIYGHSWTRGTRCPVVAVADEHSFLAPFFDVSTWLRCLRLVPRRRKHEPFARLLVPEEGDPNWSRFGWQLRGPRRILAPEPADWVRRRLVPAGPGGGREGVFLSYRWHEAQRSAVQLARALTRRGTPVWLDSLVLYRTRPRTPDLVLRALIGVGLDRCRAVVALVGPDYRTDARRAGSWVGWELSEAANRQRPVIEVSIDSHAWLDTALRELQAYAIT
ncbi:MAG: toll/interleukin-1 receptor domain-containing protein [Gammaproteobacteria bacterium]|nr:toll/interleukin-1 receptor domain-containing protein [Gammaproteobacteria bacterium]